MRIKAFLLCMLLMCSFAALPAAAQDDDGETPEFVLSDDQAVSVEGGDDSGVTREASDIKAELEKTKALYIVIRGKFVAAYWKGRYLVIVCEYRPKRLCAVIKVR